MIPAATLGTDADFSLRDRRALVTGGARGIGAAVARRFVASGARVAVTYLADPVSVEAVEKLRDELGADNLVPVVADASDSEAMRATVTRAAEAFGRMVAAQGGPVQFIDNWQRFLPEATVIREVTAREAGYIASYDGEALGLTVVGLGGGRQVESDVVDPSVGLSDLLPLGSKVAKGQPIARIHAAREDAATRAEAELRAALTIAPKPPKIPPLIHERIG